MATTHTDTNTASSMDPILHVITYLPFSLLRPPRLRLRFPTITLPSPTLVLSLLLLTYFSVVSGIIYDVIVEPPDPCLSLNGPNPLRHHIPPLLPPPPLPPPSPSPDTNLTFPNTRTLSLLLTYFSVVSGIIYDVIVEHPGIGSMQDPNTGTVRPVVFLPGRVNGQYIIEGLSSGFMFVLGGFGIMLLDLALDNSKSNNRDKSVKMSYGCAGGAFLVVSYIMSMLFLRIKIPAYLR